MKLNEAAKHMMRTGHWYDATILANELDLRVRDAQGLINNMWMSKRIEVASKGANPRLHRVNAIDGERAERPNYWRLAIFGEKLKK